MKKTDEQTFAALGIPFPLFAAPVKFTYRFADKDCCTLCQEETYCFQCDHIIEICSRCGAINGMPTRGSATHITCHACQNLMAIPEAFRRNPKVCYSCLRSGKASMGHDTQFGMVTWEQVVAGKTHGVPGLDSQYESQGLPTSETEEGWVEVHVAKEWLDELTRTPTPSSIQGESWQFHCQRPMIYLGEWLEEDFYQNAPSGDGKSFFTEIVELAEPELWDAMWQGKLHDEFAIYVYQCPLCQTYSAHWDMF